MQELVRPTTGAVLTGGSRERRARHLEPMMNSVRLPLLRPAINPWVVGVAVVIPTLMGVASWTIVGVARPYIAGGLSAPAADDGWVMTTYLAANAFILPI